MLKISAFADEISDDLDVQIQNLQANDVGYIELRGVWGKNVLALSEAEVHAVKRRAADSGIGFSAIGSPLGKFPMDGDFTLQMEGLKKLSSTPRSSKRPISACFLSTRRKIRTRPNPVTRSWTGWGR